MKRRIFKRILLFLFLGAIFNVAVAWACASFSPVVNDPSSIKYDFRWRDDVAVWWPKRCPFPDAQTPQRHPEGDDARYDPMMRGYEALGLNVLSVGPTLRPTDNIQRVYLDHVRAGLPARSMETDRWLAVTTLELRESRDEVMDAGLRWDPPVVSLMQDELSFLIGGRYLPLRPTWPGFAINTIFYAAILWLPFALFGRIRRRRRIKRGLCPACGYDLHGTGHAACPECGKAVNQ